MSQRSRVWDVILRSLVAVVVGLVVTGTAYLCAYFSMRDHPNYRVSEEYTQFELDNFQKAIEKHRKVTGRLPASLAELDEVKGERHFRVDNEGRVVDSWKHPYQYRVEGDSFALYSFGRDGQSGGDGLDADIYPSSEGRLLEVPTLRQFTFNLPTEGVQWTCFLAGVCAGLVCLLPSRNRHGARFFARVGATVIGTVLGAAVISSLHIPTGH